MSFGNLDTSDFLIDLIGGSEFFGEYYYEILNFTNILVDRFYFLRMNKSEKKLYNEFYIEDKKGPKLNHSTKS